MVVVYVKVDIGYNFKNGIKATEIKPDIDMWCSFIYEIVYLGIVLDILNDAICLLFWFCYRLHKI